ncbi:MAG: ATP synthase F1 subunit gamma [Bacteroidetes bacterium]|jgi:F-type H+-transporting ATPase subunit gamma|nr:ATP synthase F1 subunit gamma [Bacteroidota bacterium]
MPSLKEVRNRITSVSSTQQITSAMKMVSAAKLRRAQDAITQMRPYANKLREILENLSSSLDSNEGVYSRQREVKKVLLVVITSNRGLCGAFNSSVIKRAARAAREEYAGAQISYLCIGKKGNDIFRKTTYTPAFPELGNTSELFDNLKFVNVAPVAERIMKGFADGEFDKVVLFYNQFKNAAVQVTQAEQFLPVVPSASEGASKTDYIFEPGKEEIVLDLIPRSLKTQLYKALLDSFASEHGARMTAMHKATDNAKDLLRNLKITYNKARQTAITNEILEIVGGAEALKG